MGININNFIKNLIKSSYILIPIILSIFVLFYFSKENSKSKKIKEKKIENQKNAQIIIKDFNFQQVGDNNSNTYNWKINSELAKLYKETNQIECTNIICSLIKDNKEISILRSEKALIDKNNNMAFLEKLSGKFYTNIDLKAQNAQIDLKDQNIIMTNGIRTEITQPDKLQRP